MNLKEKIELITSDSSSVSLNPDEIVELDVSDIIGRLKAETISYSKEIEHIESSLNDSCVRVLKAITFIISYNPPPNYISERELKNRLLDRMSENAIDTSINDLISQNLIISSSLKKKEIEKVIYRSLSVVGYTIKDPMIAFYYYYQENKQLPGWIKDWLIKAKSEFFLNHNQREIISRMPHSSYLMAPMTRKLTNFRDKWYWLSSERVSKNPNDGLEQMMYALSEREQEELNVLQEKNIIIIHTYHYGMPIYTTNPEYI